MLCVTLLTQLIDELPFFAAQIFVSVTDFGIFMKRNHSGAQKLPLRCFLIRDYPDHATYREKGAKLACADKLGVFLSLTLCNKANFDPPTTCQI